MLRWVPQATRGKMNVTQRSAFAVGDGTRGVQTYNHTYCACQRAALLYGQLGRFGDEKLTTFWASMPKDGRRGGGTVACVRATLLLCARPFPCVRASSMKRVRVCGYGLIVQKTSTVLDAVSYEL